MRSVKAMNLDQLSRGELQDLRAAVDDAIAMRNIRERDELRRKLAAMAAEHGCTLDEIFATKRTRATGKPMRDRSSGVIWSGSGRYPTKFNRANAVAAA